MIVLVRKKLILMLVIVCSSFAFVTAEVEPEKDLCYFIVDRSGSIKTNKLIEPITVAIKKFLGDIHSNTEVRLVFFDDKRSKVKKWEQMNLTNKNDFNDYFDDEFEPAGTTCLFDTIYDSFSEIKSDDYKLVNVIILSDGDDTASKICKNWQDIEEIGLNIKESNANSFLRWYTLGFSPKETPKENSSVQHLKIKDIQNFVIKEPAPLVSFTASPQQCEVDTKILFAPEIFGKMKSVKWEFGDGTFSSSVTPFHSYSKPGTYTVKIEVKGPGGNTTKVLENFIKVRARVQLKANFIYFPKIIHRNKAIKITNESVGFSSYEWLINGKKYAEANPVVTISSDCDIVLTVTNKKGETDTKTYRVKVVASPKPIVDFIIVNKIIKAGSTIEAIDRSKNNIKSRNKWSVDGREVFVGSDFTFKTQKSFEGVHEIKLIVTNEEGITSSKSIKVEVLTSPRPVAEFSELIQKIRVGEKFTIFDQSENHIKSQNKWFLDGQEIGCGIHFKHKFSKAGLFTVKLMVFNEDNEQDIKEYKVKVLPQKLDASVSEFSITPTEPQMGMSVILSTLKPIENVKHEWIIQSSNNEVVNRKGATIKYICAESGIVNVTHKVISSIGEVTISKRSFNVVLSFSAIKIESDVIKGQEPLQIHLKENSNQIITNYKWFMNGKEFSSIASPRMTLEKEGLYLFSLEATMVDGSVVKTMKQLEVNVLAPPSFFERYWWVLIVLFILFKIFRIIFPKNPRVTGTISWRSSQDINLFGEEFVDNTNYIFDAKVLGISSEFMIKGCRGELALFKNGVYTTSIVHYEEYQLEDGISFEIN